MASGRSDADDAVRSFDPRVLDPMDPMTARVIDPLLHFADHEHRAKRVKVEHVPEASALGLTGAFPS